MLDDLTALVVVTENDDLVPEGLLCRLDSRAALLLCEPIGRTAAAARAYRT
ncbi:MAG: hypothetical protein U5K37_11325 [Natrialbaceae archaeon]|nr:hypothetical protein [Natrialbaceae archaeon]